MYGTIITKFYEFLLADPANDQDYTEGNKVGEYLVFGTAAEMKDRFSSAFNKPPIPYSQNLSGPSCVAHK